MTGCDLMLLNHQKKCDMPAIIYKMIVKNREVECIARCWVHQHVAPSGYLIHESQYLIYKVMEE
jgi:hypothetical protein